MIAADGVGAEGRAVPCGTVGHEPSPHGRYAQLR